MSTPTMPTPSIHIFTDVGVKDIDDELLLKYLANNKIPLNLLVVFTGSDGISAGNALAHWIRTFESDVLQNLTSGTSISYTTLSEYKCSEQSCDYVLQIAPLDGCELHYLEVKEKYVFAGDYITPEGSPQSFNRVGSKSILDRFNREGKLVDISSKHMAKMRFNQELVSKFTGPFRDSIVFTAFMLAFGRMNPSHSANKFAEGLINPNAGRGANYSSVMSMGFKLQGKSTDDFRAMQDVLGDDALIDIKSCGIAARNYCDSLEENGVTLKDRDGTIKSLTDINIYLQSINVSSALPLKKGQKAVISRDEIVNIFESGCVFTSDFDINSIPKEILPAWEFFKQNAEELYESFNPVYDLFAGYVLIGLINPCKDERRQDPPEVFLEKVCKEF